MSAYPGRLEGHAVTIRSSAGVVRGPSLFTFTPLSRLEQAGELVHAIQRLSLARSITDIQEIVRTAARSLTGADGATIVLRDGLHCYYADEDAISPLWKGQRFPMQSCVSGWAILNRKSVVIEDIYNDERVRPDAYRPTFVKSLVMVPIRTLDPVGAIGNYWATQRRPRPEDVELLQALADSTAVAMENVRIHAALEDTRLETLQRLALAAEYRDDSTSEHTERVARTAVLIARKLCRPEAEVSLYRLAAPLHDIGKLAVSDALLLKPGKLTEDEVRLMKRHTEAGAAILSGSTSDVLRLASEIALSHHEWWDGSGYPKGLKGHAIPLSGRIVAIADVFDALAHARPYKRAWPLADAVAEINRLCGTQFDPDVVAAFRALDPETLVGPMHPDRPAA
jgi:response regulator RpfG family c-di-GMP phosphodiesterase